MAKPRQPPQKNGAVTVPLVWSAGCACAAPNFRPGVHTARDRLQLPCIAALAATAPPGDLGRPNALLLRRHEARACDILLRSSCSCSVVIEHAKPTTDSSSGFTRCNAIFSQPSEQSAVLGSRRLLPCRRWHGFVLPRSRQSSIRRPLIDLTNSLRRTRPPPGVTELSFVQPVVRIRIGNSCRP